MEISAERIPTIDLISERMKKCIEDRCIGEPDQSERTLIRPESGNGYISPLDNTGLGAGDEMSKRHLTALKPHQSRVAGLRCKQYKRYFTSREPHKSGVFGHKT